MSEISEKMKKDALKGYSETIKSFEINLYDNVFVTDMYDTGRKHTIQHFEAIRTNLDTVMLFYPQYENDSKNIIKLHDELRNTVYHPFNIPSNVENANQMMEIGRKLVSDSRKLILKLDKE